MGVAIIGLAGTTLVAGRIAFVVGRTQRQARLTRGGRPAPIGEREV